MWFYSIVAINHTLDYSYFYCTLQGEERKDTCYFCKSKLRAYEKRVIGPTNYKQFGIDNDKLEKANNQNICEACWLSKNRKLGRNTCSAPGCSTSQRQIGRLYKPPVASFSQEHRCEVLKSVGIDENSRICKKCYHKVLEKGKQHRIPHGEVITQEATVIHP